MFTAEGKSRIAAPAPVVILDVPDAWVGRELTLVVTGLRAGKPIATAGAQVTPRAGVAVAVELTLGMQPCGEWCEPGSTDCRDGGVVTCYEAPTGCRAWSPPQPCSGSCSNGSCQATCDDECLANETTCDGPALRSCGQHDADSCTEWGVPQACPGGQRCSAGACRVECVDTCTRGATKCTSRGVTTCGDLDGDGCSEWSPAVRCGEGQACSGGRCEARCSDECEAARCDGDVFQRCGQFDSDTCKEYSEGTVCVAADSCQVGSCTASGCAFAPKCGEGTRCDRGTCVASCSDDCQAARCDGDTFRPCGNYDADPCRELGSGERCVSTDACKVGSCTASGCAYADKVCPTGSICQAGVCTTPCGDADGDGVTSCGGDCDDQDPKVFPRQATWFVTPRANGSFDYNCDGLEQVYSTWIGECHRGACGAIEGWKGSVPACGKTAGWVVSCEFHAGLGCFANTERETQPCH